MVIFVFPRVSIIILNWNGWRDTIECLESLYQIDYPNYDVIVVDNGSKDESVEKIKEYCKGNIKVSSKFFRYNPKNKPIEVLEYTKKEAEAGGNPSKERQFSKLSSNKKLRLILNDENYGFAEGNNIGIRYVLKALKPQYILLLNNDTVVDKNFLIELIKVSEKNKRIGILCPKIYYYDRNGRSDIIWFAGGKIRLPLFGRKSVHYALGFEELDNGQHNVIKEVDWVSGASMLIRIEVINKVSFLNSNYFFAYEDIEYCIKARKCGFKCIYVPTSNIWHKVGVSRSKTNNIEFRIRDILTYSIFLKENFPIPFVIYHLIWHLGIMIPKGIALYFLRYKDRISLYDVLFRFKKKRYN